MRSVHPSVSNLSASAGVAIVVFSKGSPGPRQQPLTGPGAVTRYPASYPSRPPEGDGTARHRFPVAFRPPALASWAILFPPRSSAFLTVDPPRPLPGHRAGFPRSTCARPGRGGCRLYPGSGGVHATGQVPSVAACRFPAASPAPRSPQSIYPGLTLTRCHRRFTHVHPSGLPLTCAPGWIKDRFGFSPELRTPPLPATHVRGGDRANEHIPGLRHRQHRRPPLNAPLTHATSCRTHREVPFRTRAINA